MKRLSIVILLTLFLLSSCTTKIVNETKTAPKTMTVEKDLINLGEDFLVLPLSVGDSVECEINNVYFERVNLHGDVFKIVSENAAIYVTVRDPFGNIVIENFTTRQVEPDYLERIVTVHFPWKFAFLPAANGEYTFKITARLHKYFAHIKIIIHSE